MKTGTIKICFLLLFLSAYTSIFAQGPDPRDIFVTSKKEYDEELITKLKSTKTVFFLLTSSSKAQKDSIKQAVTEGWDLTPIIFDDFENLDKYENDAQYSYFIIEGNSVSINANHFYLTLRFIKEVNKRGKAKTDALCRIELYPDSKTHDEGNKGIKDDKTFRQIYEDGFFYNFTPVGLKAQLQVVESNLTNKIRPKLYAEIKDDNLSMLLSKDTLFVPESLLVSFNGKKEKDKENPFQNYKYKYRICSDAELFNIFETEKRGRLLFEYVRSASDKFISIYDLKDKKIVYKAYAAVSFNLKSKDIEKIE